MMMLLPQLARLDTLFLTFCRVSGILVTAPIFQTQRLPLMARAGLSALLSFLLAPVQGAPSPPGDLLAYALLAGGELLVGLGFGLVANLIFTAVSIAGEMADLQSGLAFATLVDPASEERTAIIGQFQTLLAWLVFFACNGHHVLLSGVAHSFSVLPLGRAALPTLGPVGLVGIVAQTFVTAVQIGAPVLGAVLITDLALGLLARAVPQLNLLVIGLPIKMALAFFALLLSLPFLIAAERGLIPAMDNSLMDLLHLLGGT
jgi:flagellar biosynthetic protein FliR